jgi:hypothetical protein
MIDPTGQLQQHLAVTTITQQDVNQLVPTQQPAATAVGAAGEMGVSTAVVGAAEGKGPKPDHQGKQGAGATPPRCQQSTQGLDQPFVAWVTTCMAQKL